MPPEIITVLTIGGHDMLDLDLRHPATDAPTGWVWTLAGPRHAAALEADHAGAPMAARVLGFTPAVLNGERLEFSPATAAEARADPWNVWMMAQLLNAFVDERGFITDGTAPASLLLR